MTDAANYLLVVFQLVESESEIVPTGRVAAELDRSPSATTEMLQRLDEEGFLIHELYEGVTLTAEGCERGAALQESYLVLHQVFRRRVGACRSPRRSDGTRGNGQSTGDRAVGLNGARRRHCCGR
ncbi:MULTISPECIES: metal-dependent transcriptional regulator [unclassified Haloarcula]|uniref:metal-dependent transcriptional regulator n=1 Tax=unclassified Haloarcula TaxID=2624677 RepID=UPI001CDA0D9B|nr:MULTISPECIES: metal-dependent transcriptional regulator [unclassified Haloarcula]